MWTNTKAFTLNADVRRDWNSEEQGAPSDRHPAALW